MDGVDKTQVTFAQFLQTYRKGALHAEMTEALAEAVCEAMKTQKKAVLTLKLTIAPSNDEVTVYVSDDIVPKHPLPDKGGSIMYPDESGNLMRNDPRQPELPLQQVPTAKGR